MSEINEIEVLELIHKHFANARCVIDMNTETSKKLMVKGFDSLNALIELKKNNKRLKDNLSYKETP